MKVSKLLAVVLVVLLSLSFTAGSAFAADAPKIKIALLFPARSMTVAGTPTRTRA